MPGQRELAIADLFWVLGTQYGGWSLDDRKLDRQSYLDGKSGTNLQNTLKSKKGTGRFGGSRGRAKDPYGLDDDEDGMFSDDGVGQIADKLSSIKLQLDVIETEFEKYVEQTSSFTDFTNPRVFKQNVQNLVLKKMSWAKDSNERGRERQEQRANNQCSEMRIALIEAVNQFIEFKEPIQECQQQFYDLE
jgi:hypothetical protein